MDNGMISVSMMCGGILMSAVGAVLAYLGLQ